MKPNKWTSEEIAYLRQHYATQENKVIAKQLGRSDKAVMLKARELGLKKPFNSGCFRKGQAAWNKGIKGLMFSGSEKTWFPKGHKPHNTKWDGAITIRYEKNGRPYLCIRLGKGRWVHYRRYIWEKHFGTIPEGKLVTHKDGDPLNCHPGNLELISRAENARRNRNWQKALQTMDKNKNMPSRDLTDSWIAGRLAGGDPELKRLLLEERPDLIEVARWNYRLRRELREKEEAHEAV